jgi:hypothetical protein
MPGVDYVDNKFMQLLLTKKKKKKKKEQKYLLIEDAWFMLARNRSAVTGDV